MKKEAALPLLVLLMSCTSKPNYHKLIETTYNFNKSAMRPIISSDTTKSEYIEVEKKQSRFIFVKKGNFIFKVSKNPSQIEIIDSKGNNSKWVEERGYKITSKKSGDTLIVHFFPSRATPEHIFKFGTEYKFF